MKSIRNQSLVLSTALLVLLGTTNSFAQRVKNSTVYFSAPSKVGLIVITKIVHTRESAIGSMGILIEVALSVSDEKVPKSELKYDEPLKIIEPEVDPRKQFIDLFTGFYTDRGKQVLLVEDTLSDLDLKAFEPPKNDKTKYYKTDLRFLKEKYDVDEWLIVIVRYGVLVTYSYGIENFRAGWANINYAVVNSKNNSIVLSETMTGNHNFPGKWDTPPDYENLKTGIRKSIEMVIINEKKKYE